MSTGILARVGSFNSPVGGISESRHLALRATFLLQLFKQSG